MRWEGAQTVADLEELRHLRHYLVIGKKSGVPAMDLIEAIDGYLGLLTYQDLRSIGGW